MTPIEGLVVKCAGPFIIIKLVSGKILRTPRVKDLSFGDKAWICFNYTEMSIKEVLTDYEYHELEKHEEIDPEPEFDKDTGILEGKILSSSVFLSD